MAKRFFYVCAGLLCLALAYHLGAANVTAQTRESGLKVGRYAVAAGSEQVILLDTTTGATSRLETWIVPEKDFPKMQGGRVTYWSNVSPDFQHAVDAVRRGEASLGK